MGITNHFPIDSVSLENLNSKKRKDSPTESRILLFIDGLGQGKHRDYENL